jgi:ADP-L-glycero-D-manno-heptose 6-epimerase
MILITGSRGFIGKNLINVFKSSSKVVNEIDDDFFESDDWQEALKFTLDNLDADTVFHIGASSNTLERDVQYMMVRNYESTKIISDWCFERGRKLIFSSSAANYGTEEKYPSNLYGWSKYVAEGYVVKSGGIALRYFNVFGPLESQKGEMASFLCQAFVKQQKNESVLLFPGQPKRDFVYIKDVVSANLFALDNFEQLKGHWYEVSTGVASTFEKVLDCAGIEYEYANPKYIPTGYQFYTCGNRKKWMPGWQPSYTLEAGIHEYICFLQNESKVNLQN